MPKVTWTGDASSAVRAQEALTAAEKKYNEEGKKCVLTAKQLETAAKRIAEAVNPQEKYNNQMKLLAQLIDKNKISFENARLAAQKYKVELDEAGRSGEKAFGATALQNLTAIGASYLSVSRAISTVVESMREAEAQSQAAADRVFRSRLGLGQLSQFAADPDKAKAAANFEKLVNEARSFVSTGAAADDTDAANLLFQLIGSGLNKEDRQFAAQIRSAGTLTNVGGAAEAFKALTFSLGAEEVGTFREYLSKNLRAAGPAPGSFEQLPIAASLSGGSAKALGISDEFLSAATTIIGIQQNSISEGGTYLAQFLAGIEKSGVKGFEGIGGIGIVEKLASLPERQQGFGGILKDRREGISAFRTLRDNLPILKALEAETRLAQGQDLAGSAAGVPFTNPGLRAAGLRAVAEGQRAISQQDLEADRENLFSALSAERQRQRSLTAGGEGFSTFIGAIGEALTDFRGRETTDFLGELADPNAVSRNVTVQGPNGPITLLEAIRAHMESVAETNTEVAEEMKSIRRTNRGKVTTRAE